MKSVWTTWAAALAVALAGVGAFMIPRDGLPRLVSGSQAPAPQVGHPAPDFTLRSLGGSAVSLRALRGEVVLLNFWATWCIACRAEMPRLAGWSRQLRGRGLAVLGIDDGQSAGDARSYVRSLHISYPIALDPGGSVSARYDVAGLPTSVLIDRSGTVRVVTPGMLDGQYLRSQLEPLVERGRG
jgi:cytochrome c biogenesis protein CcmG/thiol:disulfide interchange protein DsbE